MIFSSITFAIFFAIVLALSRAPLSDAAHKRVLLVASQLFYAVWSPPYVVLLWFSTVVDYALAKRLHATEEAGARRALLVVSVVVNLSMLGFFKYGAFFIENVRALGLDVRAPEGFVLPVGISFYTFQTLSYTIDVYRRRLVPSSGFADYALFVSFFPQLVAGPIVRAAELLPQLARPRRASLDDVAYGLVLLAAGLAQKVLIADALLAPIADSVFGAPHPVTMTDAWIGTLAFTGQIFCDFAGYSTCAIGCARALGYALPVNFRAPYAAVGFSDFWRRWHVTLSSWLRDYLYIPLGGSAHGPARTALALVVTMLLGGLWHGAAWTFVLWGALHGAYLVVERALRAALPGVDHAAARLLGSAATFLAVVVAWVPFRATSLAHTRDVWLSMLSTPTDVPTLIAPHERALVVVVLAVLVAAHHFTRDDAPNALAARVPALLRPVVVALLLLALVLSPGPQHAFIYFQF
mgnify:CR=1 FL=1